MEFVEKVPVKTSTSEIFQESKDFTIYELKKEKKTACHNCRKTGREIKKMPVRNFGERGVTGTFGSHGEKNKHCLSTFAKVRSPKLNSR